MSDDGFESALRTGQRRIGGSIYKKRAYRKVQPAIDKAIKILNIDLERLDRHKKNIVKFQVLQEWTARDREQVNASRTVLQLKSNISQLDQIRLQVIDEEVELFDAKVQDIERKALESMMEFHKLQGSAKNDALGDDLKMMCDKSLEEYAGPMPLKTSATEWKRQRTLSDGESGSLLLQEQAIASMSDSHSEESWEELKENLQEMNGLIHDFSDLVHEQQAAVDSIEDHIEQAEMNVSEGITHLASASRLKAAAFPVAGAVIGTIVGGPVGLAVGLKTGLAVAGVGSVLGFTGGRMLKKRQATKLDVELSNLSKTKSLSESELAQYAKDK